MVNRPRSALSSGPERRSLSSAAHEAWSCKDATCTLGASAFWVGGTYHTASGQTHSLFPVAALLKRPFRGTATTSQQSQSCSQRSGNCAARCSAAGASQDLATAMCCASWRTLPRSKLPSRLHFDWHGPRVLHRAKWASGDADRDSRAKWTQHRAIKSVAEHKIEDNGGGTEGVGVEYTSPFCRCKTMDKTKWADRGRCLSPFCFVGQRNNDLREERHVALYYSSFHYFSYIV